MAPEEPDRRHSRAHGLTRLPGKPLAEIAGVPMIVCVWRQAVAAQIGPVLVAAAEPEIAACHRGPRAVEAVLTDPALPWARTACLQALEGRRSRRQTRRGRQSSGRSARTRSRGYARGRGDAAVNGADIATLAAEIDDPARVRQSKRRQTYCGVESDAGTRPRALFHPRARAVRRRPAVSSRGHLRFHA